MKMDSRLRGNDGPGCCLFEGYDEQTTEKPIQAITRGERSALKPPNLQVSINVTQAAWTQALQALPNRHFLQTWEWGALRERHGWRAHRYVCEHDNQVAAAFTLLTRRIPVLPWRIAYVPKGPVLDYANEPLFAAVLDRIAVAARDAKALYVKIDPDIPEGNASTARLYQACGWQASHEQIQFPHTAMLDLASGADALLASMKPKTRYNIRLAARRDVKVEHSTDWHELFRIYADTAKRDGFAIREERYYHDLWSLFHQSGQGECFLARVDGEAVAGLYLIHNGDTGWFYTGASSQRHRDKMPNYLLQWHAIQWLIDRGYRRYDLWGAPTVMDESDPLWGVYRFKSGFGARYERRLGAYDFVLNGPGYNAVTRLVPRLRQLRRRQSR